MRLGYFCCEHTVQQHFTVTDDQRVTPELLNSAAMGGGRRGVGGALLPPLLLAEVSRTRRSPESPLVPCLHVFTALCLKMLTGETCNCRRRKMKCGRTSLFAGARLRSSRPGTPYNYSRTSRGWWPVEDECPGI